MKRGEFSKEERELIKRIKTEYELFKYKMLSKTNIEIYDRCNIIRFYECIYEYFMYAEALNSNHINVCLKYENVISVLYDLYLKYESLECSTWEDIEEILDELMRKTNP